MRMVKLPWTLAWNINEIFVEKQVFAKEYNNM